jgi:hypothetical protein
VFSYVVRDGVPLSVGESSSRERLLSPRLRRINLAGIVVATILFLFLLPWWSAVLIGSIELLMLELQSYVAALAHRGRITTRSAIWLFASLALLGSGGIVFVVWQGVS